jgi:hypothetical protein
MMIDISAMQLDWHHVLSNVVSTSLMIDSSVTLLLHDKPGAFADSYAHNQVVMLSIKACARFLYHLVLAEIYGSQRESHKTCMWSSMLIKLIIGSVASSHELES